MNYEDISFNEQDQLSGSLFNFETVGDALKGTYIGKQENVQTKFGVKTIYKIMNNGGVFSVFGSKLLDDQMLSISLGQVIEIRYTGTKDTGKGNPMKLLMVYGRANLVNTEWLGQQRLAASINNGGVSSAVEAYNQSGDDGEINVADVDMGGDGEIGEIDGSKIFGDTPASAPATLTETVHNMSSLTPEMKRMTIGNLAASKLGVPAGEDYATAVMNFTKMALIPDNYDQIIKVLETK